MDVLSGTAAPAATHRSPPNGIQIPSFPSGRRRVTSGGPVCARGVARIPVVPTTSLAGAGRSGVNTPIAPGGTGGAVGDTAAARGVVAFGTTATGNEGALLPVVPARSPRRGRWYGCISPRVTGTSTTLNGSTVASAYSGTPL